MQNADHHSSVPRPLDPLGGAVDLPTVLANPTNASGAGISLGDGVGGDQTECSAFAQEVERPPVEVRDNVGVAVAPSVHALEPVGVPCDVTGGQVVLSRERRISDERVEPWIFPLEDFRELDLPMEWGERRVAVTLLLDPSQVAIGLAVHDGSGELIASRLPSHSALPPRRTPPEPDHRRAALRPAHRARPARGRGVPDPRNILAGFPDALAQPGYLRHVLAHPHYLEAFLKRFSVRDPVERLDLLPSQPDKRVAVAERMIQEGQRMVPRQRAQPQRHLGQVYRHGVPINAVETPLGDQGGARRPPRPRRGESPASHHGRAKPR